MSSEEENVYKDGENQDGNGNVFVIEMNLYEVRWHLLKTIE